MEQGNGMIWIKPQKALLENAIKQEAQRTAPAGAEQGIDTGVIIIPPVMDEHNAEMDGYPADYVEYAKNRLRSYKREHGELPRWERDSSEINGEESGEYADGSGN